MCCDDYGLQCYLRKVSHIVPRPIGVSLPDRSVDSRTTTHHPFLPQDTKTSLESRRPQALRISGPFLPQRRPIEPRMPSPGRTPFPPSPFSFAGERDENGCHRSVLWPWRPIFSTEYTGYSNPPVRLIYRGGISC